MILRSPTIVAFRRGHGGAVLFVSLVILLILSLLAIVTVNASLTETKKAGGMRNMQLAQFAAESALKEAQSRIESLADLYGASRVCSHIACAVRGAAAPVDPAAFMQTALAKAATVSFRADLTKLHGIDESAHLLAAAPSYVIEDLGVANPVLVAFAPGEERAPTRNFRITARGVGGTDDFTRVIEGVYSIPARTVPH